jgi:hypothetical protein
MILIAWRYMKGYIVYMFEIPRDDKKLGAWCIVHGAWLVFFHNGHCKETADGALRGIIEILEADSSIQTLKWVLFQRPCHRICYAP